MWALLQQVLSACCILGMEDAAVTLQSCAPWSCQASGTPKARRSQGHLWAIKKGFHQAQNILVERKELVPPTPERFPGIVFNFFFNFGYQTCWKAVA